VTAPPSDRPLPPADSFKLLENDFVHGLLGYAKYVMTGQLPENLHVAMLLAKADEHTQKYGEFITTAAGS